MSLQKGCFMNAWKLRVTTDGTKTIAAAGLTAAAVSATVFTCKSKVRLELWLHLNHRYTSYLSMMPQLQVQVGIGNAPTADDSPSPSIGVAAARLLEVGPEKERWRNIAKDWYAAVIAEQAGNHHLGLLSREVEGEEPCGVYHFVKRYFLESN
jgi:hypothetical protein